MKQSKPVFLLSLILLLAACGSNIEGATFVDRAGNSILFKPKGKVSVHGTSEDHEFDYTVQGSKITVKDLKKNKGFQLVTFFRVLDDGSIRSLDGTRLTRQGK